MPRTEADMLSRAPIEVKIGEDQYSIPVLTILKVREWRKKLEEIVPSNLVRFAMTEAKSADDVVKGMFRALILQFPEKIVDLVFDYAGDKLPKDKILETATEEEMVAVFCSIMEAAYPMFPAMQVMQQALRGKMDIQPPKASYTN